MSLSKRGGWLSMQVPAQRRGLHVPLLSLEAPVTYLLWMCFEQLNMLWFQAVAGEGEGASFFYQFAASGWLLRKLQGNDNMIILKL